MSVECGTIDSPPSFTNITVWGIITMICMLFVGVTSFLGIIYADFGHLFFGLINLIGSCFGFAGLIFAIISIVKKIPAHMKVSMTCYFISCLIAAVSFVLGFLISDNKIQNILTPIFHLLLGIFLCYLFFVQSKNLGSSG